ncbi:MAG: RIP metalloprotease RseP [Myxococcota bacterium]
MNLPGIFDVVIPFVLLLGVLIFIHELGHFAVAKWLGVKVEKFSIGFGPSLFTRTVGETEYVVAALPLGGFVKMLGEIPGEPLAPDEVGRAFNHRPVWQRIAIALAGPVMNLVLPVFLIAAILMAGVPTITSRIGGVLPGSVAERAGLREGDRVVAVGGEPIWRWEDLETRLRAPGAAALGLEIEREGATRSVELVRDPEADGGFGAAGLSWHAPVARVGVTDPASPSAQAGIRTGDRIVSVNGQPVANFYVLERLLATLSAPLEVELVRPLDGETETVRTTLRELPSASPTPATLGLVPVGVRIAAVEPTSPAKRAGLQSGDVVLSVNGGLATTSEQMKDLIWGSGGVPLELLVVRDKQELTLHATPTERPMSVEGRTETHWGIGVSLGPSDEGAEYKDEVVRNPFVALARGAERTGEILVMIVAGVAQLVTGHVGMSSLSGPIGIGEIAADAYQTSWAQFVWLMAVISVNLAILNLLPIPVLDGGQIVLAAAEGIKGSPLPARARDVAQTVGLSLILLLMGVAFWNDIARHWSGVVQFFSTLG